MIGTVIPMLEKDAAKKKGAEAPLEIQTQPLSARETVSDPATMK